MSGENPDRKPNTGSDSDLAAESARPDIPQMMSAWHREHDEPRDGFEPVPVWMALIFGGLLFWGGWYFAGNSGRYDANTLDTAEPNRVIATDRHPETPEELAVLGRAVYATRCAMCHQADGQGVKGIYPPLSAADWTAGEPATAERLVRLMLHGGSGEWTVNGEKYSAPMPAYGFLSDVEIAAVLTYVRSGWSNRSPAVSVTDVAAVRARIEGRPTNGSAGVTQAELTGSASPKK